MSNMYYMVTITKREYGEEYLRYLYGGGVHCLSAALCEGTAQQKTLDLLGLEKTEKVMISSVVSKDLAGELLRGLMRTMRIDVPGNGIAFTVPLQSVVNHSSLKHLTQGQNFEPDKEREMEDNRYSLVVVIAQNGHTESVMDAARGANAGGGTIVHAKGISEKSAAQFFGMSLASEQDLIYIVAKRKDEKDIMRAIMDHAAAKDGGVQAVFSLPVNQVVGLRSLLDD